MGYKPCLVSCVFWPSYFSLGLIQYGCWLLEETYYPGCSWLCFYTGIQVSWSYDVWGVSWCRYLIFSELVFSSLVPVAQLWQMWDPWVPAQQYGGYGVPGREWFWVSANCSRCGIPGVDPLYWSVGSNKGMEMGLKEKLRGAMGNKEGYTGSEGGLEEGLLWSLWRRTKGGWHETE